MSITTQLTHSCEAWKYLKGLVCIYKPPGYSLGSIIAILKQKCVQDLNSMERTIADSSDRQRLLSDSESSLIPRSHGDDIITSNGEIQDYASHPSVLGDGYNFNDMSHLKVNDLGLKVSGLCLVGLNDLGVIRAKTLKRARMLTTYQIRGEFGRATRTGWSDGKTAKCSGWQHLAAKPHLLEQMLVNICSSHQARSWQVASVGVDTQEAYEIACQGPVRPGILSETLIYNIQVKEMTLPHFMLELQCVQGTNDGDQGQLVRMVEELGIKCRTVASVHSVRCAAIGPWSADNSLLVKHFTLQNVLNNMGSNRRIYKQNVAKRGNIHRPTIVSINNKFTHESQS